MEIERLSRTDFSITRIARPCDDCTPMSRECVRVPHRLRKLLFEPSVPSEPAEMVSRTKRLVIRPPEAGSLHSDRPERVLDGEPREEIEVHVVAVGAPQGGRGAQGLLAPPEAPIRVEIRHTYDLKRVARACNSTFTRWNSSPIQEREE